MALFDYKALNPQGRTEKGFIEAENVKAARIKLKKRGLAVTAIQEKTAASAQKSGGGLPFMGSRVGARPLALLTRQLASLVKANIPLVEALNAVVEQTDQVRLKVAIEQVKQDVNEGTSLAKALAKHGDIFDITYINMVEAGESSGTLSLVLVRLADLKEAQLRLRGKVVSGMTYPVLIMIVGGVLVIAVFTFLIPKLTKIFDSMNKAIPPQTQFMMAISDLLTGYWYALGAGAFALFQLWRRWVKTPAGRLKWDGFKLRVPYFGTLFRMIAVTRFANTMGTLLESSVPIMTAMSISKNLTGNVLIANAIDRARENIKEGQSIAEPLKRSGEFPPLVIHMISVGERTGELPSMLKNVSETFEEQVTARITGLVNIIEPAMIVVMGGFVAFIFFAIFVPLMEIGNFK